MRSITQDELRNITQDKLRNITQDELDEITVVCADALTKHGIEGFEEKESMDVLRRVLIHPLYMVGLHIPILDLTIEIPWHELQKKHCT